MGFPDNWTEIPVKTLKKAPSRDKLLHFGDQYAEVNGQWVQYAGDSARYKACGNSMCVNVMRWIGMRIENIEKQIRRKNETIIYYVLRVWMDVVNPHRWNILMNMLRIHWSVMSAVFLRRKVKSIHCPRFWVLYLISAGTRPLSIICCVHRLISCHI